MSATKYRYFAVTFSYPDRGASGDLGAGMEEISRTLRRLRLANRHKAFGFDGFMEKYVYISERRLSKHAAPSISKRAMALLRKGVGRSPCRVQHVIQVAPTAKLTIGQTVEEYFRSTRAE